MKINNSFFKFIEEKPLYYKEIDHKRVHIAYEMLKPHIVQPLTIHVVGTNGKGSTGRIMATLLDVSGHKVGHFSSPHILKFNERMWINGKDISNEALDVAHERLYSILGEDISNALSYFEYTTLLAFVAMEHLDVIVLEAGLGGEFDATNVCSKKLSVITPIGLDHQDFLGESIEEIATTKMNSINKEFVLAYQVHKEVYEIAEKREAILTRVDTFQEIFPAEYEEVKRLTKQLEWSQYLFENTLTALYALKKVKLSYSLVDLLKVKLFGRFYRLSSNVTIDVGHNLLAAKAIIKALKEEHKIVLVYNALEDKDYFTILELFKPYVKRVEIIKIDTPRAVKIDSLEKALKSLKISYDFFDTVDKDEEYLVFGSFYVIETFLNKIKQNIN